MKKLLLVVPLLFMVGCTASVPGEAWNYADDKCSTNNGVGKVTSQAISYRGLFSAICNNGAIFNYSGRSLVAK